MAEEKMTGILVGKSIDFTVGAIISQLSSDQAKSKWETLRDYLKDYKPHANHEIQQAVLRSYYQATLQTCIMYGERFGISVKECLIKRIFPKIMASGEVKLREIVNSTNAPQGAEVAFERKYREWVESIQKKISKLSENISYDGYTLSDSEKSEKEWLEKVIEEYTELLDALERNEIDFPDEQINRELNQFLKEKSYLMQPASESERESKIRDFTLRQIRSELVRKFGELPESYRQFFLDNWYNFFCGSFQFQLTQNHDLATKFQNNVLAGVDCKIEQVIYSLNVLSNDLNEKYDDIKNHITELSDQNNKEFEEIKNLLFSFLPLITSFDSKEVRIGIVKEINNNIPQLYRIRDEINEHTSWVGEDVKQHNKELTDQQTKTLISEFRNSEDNKVRHKFEKFSPSIKIKKVSHPKLNEQWNLKTTLLSGLTKLLSESKIYGDSEPEPKGFFKRIFWKWDKDSRRLIGEEREKKERAKAKYNFDNRPFHEYPEEYLESNFPNWKIKSFSTKSIAWHPKGNYLVTTGERHLTKLWRADGNLIPITVRFEANYGTQTISWSSPGGNKRIFIANERLYDNMGNYLRDIEISEYTISRYEDLREIRRRSNYLYGTSHLSSNHNFSPWRPNSNQLIEKRGVEKLELVNALTGDIEKTIDCKGGVITDFAWHPSGYFIAVSFEEQNIKIFDIESGESVGKPMSVQHILGWSDDGKVFVGRKEGYKRDFVIWDATEMEEKSMPEEMEKDTWFQKFFKNISADGLRYIKLEDDKTKNSPRSDHYKKGSIYSVESDQLVATLPKKLTFAAWSPIDGGLLATCGGSETHIWRLG